MFRAEMPLDRCAAFGSSLELENKIIEREGLRASGTVYVRYVDGSDIPRSLSGGSPDYSGLSFVEITKDSSVLSEATSIFNG